MLGPRPAVAPFEAWTLAAGEREFLVFENPWPEKVVRVRELGADGFRGYRGRFLAFPTRPGGLYELIPVPRLTVAARLDRGYLAQVHAVATALRGSLYREASEEPYDPAQPAELDLRVILHCHSHISHDSRGTIDEIAQAARRVGVKAVLMSDHPPETANDVIARGFRGEKYGVLFAPGAEEAGFLASPIGDEYLTLKDGFIDRVDAITKNGGLLFFSHPEEGRNFDLTGVLGMEIYNLHTDIKDELRVMRKVGPAILPLLLVAWLLNQDRAIFSVFDPPIELLELWDRETQRRRFVGIAANDSHNNVGVVVQRAARGELIIEDVSRRMRYVIPAERVAGLLDLIYPECGEWSYTLDPYELSFGHVSTHVLAREHSLEAIFDSLREGRCYVGFDGIADPTGFRFTAYSEAQGQISMGAEQAFLGRARLEVLVPAPAEIRLVRDGLPIRVVQGRRLDHEIDQPGVYRVEVWVPFPDEMRPWILSNPIYLRSPEKIPPEIPAGLVEGPEDLPAPPKIASSEERSN